jgi:hypothetical protein
LNDLSDEEKHDDPPIRKYKAGRNPVWWVDKESSGGEVDTSFLQDETINLSAANIRDLVDPGDIPEDLAARSAVEHGIIEEYSPNTKWQDDRKSGMGASTFGFVLILAAVLVSVNPIGVPDFAVGIIALFGMAFAAIGLGTLTVGIVMGLLTNFGYAPETRWPTRKEVRQILSGEKPDFEGAN